MITKTTIYQSENDSISSNEYARMKTYQSGRFSGDEYVMLNVLNSIDIEDFEKIPCNPQSAHDACFNEFAIISLDPRLISPPHNGQRLVLDNLPINGKVQVWDIPYIEGHRAASYDSYSDINGGQNTYYYSKDLAVPFISQLFVKPGVAVKENYVDPMDSYKPHYCRARIDHEACLSWLRDSQFHREDLMSKQIWKRNQTNYEVDAESKSKCMAG